MSNAMKRLLIAGGFALVIGGMAIPLAQAPPNPPCDWCVGDVFVAVGGGKYEVFSKAGVPKAPIVIANTDETAGCWFDSQFNLYTADFDNTRVIRHQLAGSHAQDVFANTNAEANNGHSQSIVMAVNGDVYVGNAGGGSPAKSILRYRSDRAFIQKFLPVTESGGINWMDLSTDQRTMFYTSLGRTIKRFNVFTGNQDGDFATLPAGSSNVAHAIRLLAPFDGTGGLLVADNSVIRRIGSIARTYDIAGEDSWRSLNLDPDGVHFWAGGFTSGKLYRFPLIASGSPNAVIAPNLTIQTGGANALMGLCVMGQPQTQIQPLQLSTGANTPQPVDVTANFGDPGSKGDPGDFYSFSTWRLRIKVRPNQSIVAAVSFTPQTSDKVCSSSDPNDFDCRFTDNAAVALSKTQCVPFFRDPSATVGMFDQYRCGYYRVKDMPLCSADSPGSCVFDVTSLDFVGGTGSGRNDILSQILMDLTNPPQDVFPVTDYGPAPKGNPRLMRDPDSVPGNQFLLDATTAVIDWPAFGTGTPNDYVPVMRVQDSDVANTAGGCVEIIKPDGVGQNKGSSIKVIIEARYRATDGTCTGDPIENATGGLNNPNNVTLAIANQALGVLVIYCDTPGNSLGCFTPVNGQPGRYQSTVDLTNPPFIPDNDKPYTFAVTSVNSSWTSTSPQGAGLFSPVCRNYFICKNGSNCGPPVAPVCQ